MNKYIIFTDGSLKGNYLKKDEKPLRGGYAALIYDENLKLIREIYGGLLNSTSQRMEVMAVIEALKTITEPSEIKIISDSQYVISTLTKGWLNSILAEPDKFSNVDLWKQFPEFLNKHHITFEWTKGHANDDKNNKADKLAQFAARLLNLPKDEYCNNSKKIGESLVSESKTRWSDGFNSRQENGEILHSFG